MSQSKQGCKTAAVCLAPGLQVPPQVTSDQDGNQSSESTGQQPQFHRAQSVTSAVDYEYFDVGIGQVPHIDMSMITCAWVDKSFDASPSCFSPPPACLDRPMEA